MIKSMTSTEAQMHGKQVGIYTKTLIESPVVRWILYARIRDNRCNDVILVGDDFIRVEQLEAQGHLRHIATKRDFDAKILAASTLRTGPKLAADELLIKQEPDEEAKWLSEPPSEDIVLALSTCELLFIHLSLQNDGSYEFLHRRLNLPSSPDPINSLGEHLCVDPESRAIAVAAMEREVWLCTIKDPGPMETNDSDDENRPWPTASRLIHRVQGVIQNMSFLNPQVGDEDHVILLLIVIDSGRTKAIWIDWYHPSSLEDVKPHVGQALDSSICMSSLLIPLKDASFLLVKEQEITLWKNLLSGSATAQSIRTDAEELKHPGLSSKEPAWVSWTRPCRNLTSRQQRDDLYIALEDGQVFFLSIGDGSLVEMSFAGDLDCHVGTAFAAFGDEFDPDILAVAADMSNGRIVTIGAFPQSENSTRRDVMSMSLTQWLPNWASTMDMTPSDLGTAASSTRLKHSHGFYVTAGRQPYGSVVELRRGLEVQVSAYFGLEGLKSVTDIWALPDLPTDSVFIVISRPTTTQILQVSPDITEVNEVVAGPSIITTQRTLAAGILSRNHFVQVTSHNISVTRTLGSSSEDTRQVLHDESVEILMATVISHLDAIVYVCNADSQFVLEYRTFSFGDETEETWMRPATTASFPLGFEPICIAVTSLGPDTVIALATADNRIAIRRGRDDELFWFFNNLPSVSGENVSVCDHVAILHPTTELANESELLVVCGLKDGRIVTFHVDIKHTEPFRGSDSIKFSNSAVNVVQLDFAATNIAAISGIDICLLSWTGGTPTLSSVDNIWASDKSRPDLPHGPVAACTMMPSGDAPSLSALSGFLIMVCQDEILVGPLQRYLTAVPREIPVSGTPNRLIYSEDLRCLVCSSEYCGVRATSSSRSHGASKSKRQRWPVIDFIPVKNNAPSFTYTLQPGERVHALLPWSHRSSEGKTYSYILVGGSYLKPNGVRRGRVSLLQPQVRSREVTGLHNEPHNIKFDHEVFALAKYDATTFVACSGDDVYVYRFSVETKKWEQLCVSFRLASPGICISTLDESEEHKLITVSTTRDSIVALRLKLFRCEKEPQNQYFELIPASMGPHAEICQSHLTLSVGDSKNGDEDHEILTLVSTKDARLVGLKHPNVDPTRTADKADTPWKQAETAFHASLTGTLRRIWACEPFGRKGRPPTGITDRRIVGCRTDGAIVGIALLDRDAWRRLAWLQRLCEWSEELSPCSATDPPYTMDCEAGGAGEDRRLPMGLGDAYTWVKLQSRLGIMEDYQVDGDVVGRVLKRDGHEAVKRALRRICETDSGCGPWLREHLEEELRAVDEMVKVVRSLHSWM